MATQAAEAPRSSYVADVPFVFVGGLKAQLLPVKAAILAIVTICTCYLTSSVILGHTPLWLPDITHCARGSPERYFFRIGMSCSCCMLVVVWLMTASWAEKVCNPWRKPGSLSFCSGCHAVSNEKAGLYGAVGCLLLIMGSCCIEPDDMPWTFHTIGATGFFICQMVAIYGITTNITKAVQEAEARGAGFPQGVDPSSLKTKHYCLYAFAVLLGLEILFPIVGYHGPCGQLLEWLLTANVMVWVTSLAGDFKASKLYAAAVEPQPQDLKEAKAVR